MTESVAHRPLVEALDAWFALFVRQKTIQGVDLECLRAARRISAHLPPSDEAVTRELLVEAATRYLQEELERLAPYCPNGNGRLSRLEALRLQYLEGKSTKEIVYDHPISRSAYFELRHSALELLAERAEDAVEAEAEGGGPEGDNVVFAMDVPPGLPASSLRGRTVVWVVVAMMAIGMTAIVATRWPGSIRSADPNPPHPRLGQTSHWVADRVVLSAAFPRLQIPSELGSPAWAMTLPGQDGAVNLLVATSSRQGRPGVLALFDPRQNRLIWRLDWAPPRDQVLMYDVEEQAQDEPYSPAALVWGSAAMNLGPYVVATYVQMWGPSFIVVVNRATGEEVRHYAHPGRLEGGSHVGDVDGDGEAEVLLGGQDNTLDQPVVVVLEVPGADGAASTTTLSPGREGALGRVILPDLPQFRQVFGLNRFVAVLDRDPWSDASGRLCVHVGGAGKSQLIIAYICYLDLRNGPEASILVGDSAMPWWSQTDMDAQEELAGLETQVEFLGRLWE